MEGNQPDLRFHNFLEGSWCCVYQEGAFVCFTIFFIFLKLFCSLAHYFMLTPYVNRWSTLSTVLKCSLSCELEEL